MEFRLPELGEGVYEAELVAWLVKAGDAVKRGQNLMEVLTDKASMEVPSPFHGTITSLQAEPGQKIKVGDTVLTYTGVGRKDGESSPQDKAAKTQEPRSETKSEQARRTPSSESRPAPQQLRSLVTAPVPNSSVRAAPSVRQLARKLGVDLASVKGSGPGGRILIEDLTSYVKPVGAVAEQPSAEPRLDFGRPGSRIKLQGIRRKIAEHMVVAKRTIPHYSYVDECEVSELVRLRESLRETYQKAGVRLTYLAFFVKAVVAALREVPIVNASLDEEAGEIVLHDHYHIGIAVATPSGLIVPVIHDADRKDLAEIARDIEQLSTATRAGKAKLEDLRGGTFTITSIGNVGGLFSTPVINHPEVAILGVGKIVKRPVFDDAGNVRPADLVYLSLSFDHRVVDGAVGAAFGNAISSRLRSPATLLLPEKLS